MAMEVVVVVAAVVVVFAIRFSIPYNLFFFHFATDHSEIRLQVGEDRPNDLGD